MRTARAAANCMRQLKRNGGRIGQLQLTDRESRARATVKDLAGDRKRRGAGEEELEDLMAMRMAATSGRRRICMRMRAMGGERAEREKGWGRERAP